MPTRKAVIICDILQVMENCVLKKVLLEDSTPIRIYVTLGENSLELVLLQNENAWKSSETSKNLNKFAAQHKLSLEEYCKKIIHYVKTPASDITFALNESEFIISRLLNKFKVKYFASKIEKVNYVDSVEQIMDTFSSENITYSELLNNAMKEKALLETSKINCELALKELTEKKKSDEEELFGHFVLILNEKKQHIQHLTELLETFKNGRSLVNPPVCRKKNKKESEATMKKLETVSASEPSESSNSNTNTDEEDNSPLDVKNKQEEENVEPSTSFSFLQEDNFPETFLLPKRMKADKSSSEMVVPTTSRAPQQSVDNQPQDSKRSGSPEIDINTQQLFDML